MKKNKTLIIKNPSMLAAILAHSDDLVPIIDRGKKDGENDDRGMKIIRPGDKFIIRKKDARKKNKT